VDNSFKLFLLCFILLLCGHLVAFHPSKLSGN
jgi:hypothetical protein